MTHGFSTFQKLLVVLLGAGVLGAGALFLTRVSGDTQLAMTLSPPSLQDGLVAHWTFDGKDILNGVQDVSGWGNHGTGTAPTTTVKGVIGQGLSLANTFTGIRLASSSSLRLSNDGGTLAGWFKWETPINQGKFATIFRKQGHSNFAVESAYMFGLNNTRAIGSKPFFRATIGQFDNTHQDIIDDEEIERDRWYHGAFSWSSTTMQLYLDGVLASSTTKTVFLNYIDTSPDAHFGWIGYGRAFDGGSTETCECALDDLRIYDRELGPAEIKQLYDLGATTKVATTPPPPSTAAGIGSGLVGHWTFDGRDMPNGQVNDKSGQGNHGSMLSMATATAYAKGVIGQALRFDNVLDHRVVVPPNASLEYGLGDVSLATWVKRRDPAGSEGLYHNRGSHGNAAGLAWKMTDTDMHIEIGSTFYFFETADITDTNWHHVALTLDRDALARVYIDGVVLAETEDISPEAGDSLAAEYGHQIGQTSDTEYLDGVLDDFRIYNRVLSAAEVKQLYDIGATTKVATTPPPPSAATGIGSGLVGHWTFDGKDMPNGQVNDRSGQGNHGSMLSMATATAYAKGVIGQGLKFDGVDDRILVASDDIPFGVQPRTVAFWFAADAFNDGTADTMFKHSNTGGEGAQFKFAAEDRAVSVAFDGHRPITPKNTLNIGTWYHLAVVIPDGATMTDDVLVYIDGVKQTLTNENGTPKALNTADVQSVVIGSEGASNYFIGKIDDVRIYSRALSADEAKQLYQMGR